MHTRTRIGLLVVGCCAVVGCKSDSGPPASAPAADEAPKASPTPGFSASLSAELGGAGSGGTAGDGAGSGGATGGVVPIQGPGSGAASAMVDALAQPAEIKLALEPGWERDAAGLFTISRRVRVESSGLEETFVFDYGYDAPGAPADREAYKRFLGEQKLLRVARDRQLGAAWYLEGSDAKGRPAFRFLVTYGGKRLVCHGPLYRDSRLGDVRDEVILQAKKICESIQL